MSQSNISVTSFDVFDCMVGIFGSMSIPQCCLTITITFIPILCQLTGLIQICDSIHNINRNGWTNENTASLIQGILTTLMIGWIAYVIIALALGIRLRNFIRRQEE